MLSQLVIPDDDSQSVVQAPVVPGIFLKLNEEKIHGSDWVPLKIDQGEAFVTGIIISLGVQHFTWFQSQAAGFSIAGLT